MSKTSSDGQRQYGGGAQRAAEVSDAMLGVPGYADDSILFMVRYGSLAQDTLRKVDYDEFMKRIHAIHEHHFTTEGKGPRRTAAAAAASGGERQATGEADPPDPRAARAAELRTAALDKIREFPELVRDFDKFTSCTLKAGARYR